MTERERERERRSKKEQNPNKAGNIEREFRKVGSRERERAHGKDC